MIQRLIGPAAVVLLAISTSASATVIDLNFGNFAYGTQIGEYYNGGRDSYHRQGYNNYGLSFSGASIRYTPRGAYLAGPAVITFDSATILSLLGTQNFYVSFNAGRYDIDGGNAEVSYADGNYDAIWISGNGNPYCGIWPGACDAPHRGTMGGYGIFPWTATDNTLSAITKIKFNTSRLDNVQIHGFNSWDDLNAIIPPEISGTRKLDRDIPEPASMTLLGIGALALLARRRRS